MEKKEKEKIRPTLKRWTQRFKDGSGRTEYAEEEDKKTQGMKEIME